jgi:hypothetical protein
MSLAVLRDIVAELPRVIADQILGYAESVERELPHIFERWGTQSDHTLAEELVFLAGVRKLHAIVASSYWTLDNSATLLTGPSIDNIRVGELDYSRDGELHRTLRSLLETLENVLAAHNLSQYLYVPLSEVLTLLTINEHP